MKKILILLLFSTNIILFASDAHTHNWKLINEDEYYCEECLSYYHGSQPKSEIVVEQKNDKRTHFDFLTILKSKPINIILNSLLAILIVFVLTKYLRFIYNDSLTYDEERHITNTLSFFIPSITVFVFCVKPLYSGLWILGIPIAIIPALFAGMLGMLIGNSINLSRSEHYNLSNEDASVNDEKLKQKSGIAAILLSSFSLFKNTKKAIKNIKNVDGWKEMK